MKSSAISKYAIMATKKIKKKVYRAPVEIFLLRKMRMRWNTKHAYEYLKLRTDVSIYTNVYSSMFNRSKGIRE